MELARLRMSAAVTEGNMSSAAVTEGDMSTHLPVELLRQRHVREVAVRLHAEVGRRRPSGTAAGGGDAEVSLTSAVGVTRGIES